jgi:hypothetical protein
LGRDRAHRCLTSGLDGSGGREPDVGTRRRHALTARGLKDRTRRYGVSAADAPAAAVASGPSLPARKLEAPRRSDRALPRPCSPTIAAIRPHEPKETRLRVKFRPARRPARPRSRPDVPNGVGRTVLRRVLVRVRVPHADVRAIGRRRSYPSRARRRCTRHHERGAIATPAPNRRALPGGLVNPRYPTVERVPGMGKRRVGVFARPKTG